MPLENRLSNSYDPSMGFAEGIRNLGQILAQGPAIRARAAYMNAEGQRANAMSDEAVAHANLYQSQAEREQQGNDAIRKIQKLQEEHPIEVTPDGGLKIPAEWGEAVADNAGLAKSSTDQGGGFKGVVAALTSQFEQQQNRKSKESIAAGTDASRERISASNPVIIPSGGTEASKTGSILAQGGVSLPAGDERLAPMSFADNLANAGRLSYDVKPQVQATNPKPTPSGSPGQDSQLARMLATVVGDRNKAGTNSIPNVVGQYESGLNYARTNTAFASKPSSAPSAAPEITKDHAQWLIDHDTPENRASFDRHYGAGSAAKIFGDGQQVEPGIE